MFRRLMREKHAKPQAAWRPQLEVLESRTLLTAKGGPDIDAVPVDCGCHDRVVTPRIINGDFTTGFPSVGMVGDQSEFFCTGTLIDDNWVLTAAHCVADLGPTKATFKVGGTTYATVRVILHPKTDLSDDVFGTDPANDIALLELATPVVGITPSELFRGTPHVDDVLTLVGFGAGGTGNSGEDGTYGTKRVGETPIDGVSVRLITWDFENNSESNTAPGDSGGPAFLDVGGEFQIAGITSGGSNNDSSIGDESFDTRVDAYADWIDTVIGGDTANDDDHGDSFNNPTAITIGSTATGTIEAPQDLDFFKFTATKKQDVTVALKNLSTIDPFLAVYNDKSKRIRFNDDAGSGQNSKVTFGVKAGQTFFIVACGFEDETGDYLLKVKAGSSTSSARSAVAADAVPDEAAVAALVGSKKTGRAAALFM